MKNQSNKTDESYQVAGKLMVRKFGDIPIKEITFDKVRDWRDWLTGWQSQDTVRNNIICLRMVLKFCAKRGFPVMNYQDIPVQQREKKKIYYLTDDEVQEFIEVVGLKCRGYSEVNRLRNVAIVTLLYATGIRNSELCALNVDDIKDRSFTVTGKSKEERICFIDPRTESILNNYLALRHDRNPAMFISHKSDMRITSAQLRNVFAVIRERYPKFKKVHPHTIRHSFGTKMLERKVDLRHIGDLMGHQDLNTTKRYTHYTNPALKAVYDSAHSY